MDETALRQQVEAWRLADPNPNTAQELRRLLEHGDMAELADRFIGPLEFGTAGLRGVVGAGPNRMNRAVVRRTTAGLARYLKANVPGAAERGVVVGRDGRHLSAEFAEDTACVLAAEGVVAHVFPGLVPTPLTAFATLRLFAAGGVMVTASHNPPEYNGYKVYWGNGAQIIPPHDQGIAQAIARVEAAHTIPRIDPDQARARGLWKDIPDPMGEEYLAAINDLRVYRKPAPTLKIVYTALHGVGGPWIQRAFHKAGLSAPLVVTEQQEPDGRFPTVRFPNPEEPGAMDLSTLLAERSHADLVLANDPDADRLAVMARTDEGQLRMLTGNEVGVLLGHFLLSHAPSRPQPVISTIVSSAQLGHIAREMGALYDDVLTGFKWIANQALEREKEAPYNFVFGYEEALGYSAGAVVRDKDGIGAALVFADLAAECQARNTTVLGYLEEIQRRFGLYVGTQRNFTFPGAEGQRTISRILEGFRRTPPERIGRWPVVARCDYLRGERVAGSSVIPLTLPPSNVLAYELEGGGRLTLRPSGTEPKIKYYFELREALTPGEAMKDARQRAELNLREFVDAFLALARQRGQP